MLAQESHWLVVGVGQALIDATGGWRAGAGEQWAMLTHV